MASSESPAQNAALVSLLQQCIPYIQDNSFHPMLFQLLGLLYEYVNINAGHLLAAPTTSQQRHESQAAKPCFYRPEQQQQLEDDDEAKTILASGWMEELIFPKRSSKQEPKNITSSTKPDRSPVVWKEVLVLLVLKKGETVLWIKREVIEDAVVGLETVHRIPMKRIEGIECVDFHGDVRLSLALKSKDHPLVYRCNPLTTPANVGKAAIRDWQQELQYSLPGRSGERRRFSAVENSGILNDEGIEVSLNTVAAAALDRGIAEQSSIGAEQFEPSTMDQANNNYDAAPPPPPVLSASSSSEAESKKALRAAMDHAKELPSKKASLLAPKSSPTDSQKALSLEQELKKAQEKLTMEFDEAERNRREAREERERQEIEERKRVEEEEAKQRQLEEKAQEEKRREEAAAVAVAQERLRKMQLEQEERKRREQEIAAAEENRKQGKGDERLKAMEREAAEWANEEHRRREAEKHPPPPPPSGQQQQQPQWSQARPPPPPPAGHHPPSWQQQQQWHGQTPPPPHGPYPQQQQQQQPPYQSRHGQGGPSQAGQGGQQYPPQQQGHPPRQFGAGPPRGYPPPNNAPPPSYHPQQQQSPPNMYPQQQQHNRGAGPHPPPPPHAAAPPPPPPSSAVNDKYAKMVVADGQAGMTAIKRNILLHWALQPPQYQVLRPIPVLITSIHTVFPPAFGVDGHDYFRGWKEIAPTDLLNDANSNLDDERLKKAVKKLRFFLHPDKLPRDLNEQQTFMSKMLWDISNDAYEEHQTKAEQLDWAK